jgi:hypothetical protein
MTPPLKCTVLKHSSLLPLPAVIKSFMIDIFILNSQLYFSPIQKHIKLFGGKSLNILTRQTSHLRKLRRKKLYWTGHWLTLITTSQDLK